MTSKRLIVYVANSYYRYPRLYEEHLYEINEQNVLTVYERNVHSGEETVCSVFRTWDYFVINTERID